MTTYNNSFTETGLVATTPQVVMTQDGISLVSFRMASGSQKFDPQTSTWVTDATNWYTVSATGRLAMNAGESIEKGDRIIVSGRLKIRDWDNGERSGTAVEIDADVIAHDLNYGQTKQNRATPLANNTPHQCDCDDCGVEYD